MTKHIDLDALLGVAGEITFKGETHVVLPLDGAAYKIALRMRAGTMSEDEAIDATYAIAARCCPTIEDIFALDLRQVGALVALAGEHIKEVEQHPKSSRPVRPLVHSANGMEDATVG